MSTLDHLTDGRIGWNVVTGYLDSAARGAGKDKQTAHDDRYDVADEYMEVVYKLWEGSWEDDAALRDRISGIFVDPAKVHRVRHEGNNYRVDAIHLSEPSPQRTPVLYQAGTSPRPERCRPHRDGQHPPRRSGPRLDRARGRAACRHRRHRTGRGRHAGKSGRRDRSVVRFDGCRRVECAVRDLAGRFRGYFGHAGAGAGAARALQERLRVGHAARKTVRPGPRAADAAASGRALSAGRGGEGGGS